MQVFALAGSLRRESLNRRLLHRAAMIAREAGAEVDLADLRDFDMPLYDQDREEAVGVPPGALALADRLAAADALLLASPEYNFSIPGPLKNAIDWVSRRRPSPWLGKPALLLSASPSLVGGNRGLWALRIPLECLGVIVHPEMYSLPSARTAFDEVGRLREPARDERLERLVGSWLGLAEALAAAQAPAAPPRSTVAPRPVASALA